MSPRFISAFVLACSSAAIAQPALDWHTVAGGGGACASGSISISGTFAQHDAGTLSSGSITVSGGFWVTPAAASPRCGSADFNCDGDIGIDADIAAFFACLAGNCPAPPCTNSADFNADGDVGTDADIAAFFRVLAGGSC